LYLTSTACTLDGTYALNFSVACGAGVPSSNCSLSVPSDFVGSVTFTLQSENFCATASVDVGIVGNVRSYANQSFDAYPPETAFILGRRAYYLVKLNSDLNTPLDANGNPSPDLYVVGGSGTVVSFASVAVDNVAVAFSNGTQQRVISAGAAQNYAAQGIGDLGTLAQIHTTNAAGVALQENEVGFSFVWTRQLVAVPQNQEVTVTVVADVTGTYANQGNKRFGLASSGNDSSSYTIDSNVQDSGYSSTVTSATGTPTNSGTGTPTNSGTPTSSGTPTGATTKSSAKVPTESSDSVSITFNFVMIIAALMLCI